MQQNPTPGVLEVITGPMFSGKTTSLIEHAHKTGARYIWKPRKDVRDSSDIVRSHDGLTIEGRVLDDIKRPGALSTLGL